MAEALQWPSSDQPWEGRALWPAADAPPPWAELADARCASARAAVRGGRARARAAAASAAETAASAATSSTSGFWRTMAARMAAAALAPAERAALAQLAHRREEARARRARARLGGGEHLDGAATAEEAVEAAVDELARPSPS